MCGQPPDTAVMSFDSGRSISWMIVSLTDDPTCSNSYVSGLSLADCVFSGRRAGSALAHTAP